MFTNTYKYKTAAHTMYCGGDKCSSSSVSPNCTFRGSLKPCPTGYKHSSLCKGTCGCKLGSFKARCFKDGNNNHWNPLPEKIGVNPEVWSEADVNAATSCCTNGESSSAGKSNCGTFLWDGTGDAPNDCAAVLNKWCKYGDNILKPECKSIISTRPELQNILKSRCPSKKTDAKWSDVCACYYDYGHYDTIAKIVENEWTGPPGGISRIPECIDPKCAASIYKRSAIQGIPGNQCPSVSFAQCVQNANVDISDSTIGDIRIKSECNIGSSNWQKKSNNIYNNNTTSGGGSYNNTTTSGGGSYKIIVIIIIIVINRMLIEAVVMI